MCPFRSIQQKHEGVFTFEIDENPLTRNQKGRWTMTSSHSTSFVIHPKVTLNQIHKHLLSVRLRTKINVMYNFVLSEIRYFSIKPNNLLCSVDLFLSLLWNLWSSDDCTSLLSDEINRHNSKLMYSEPKWMERTEIKGFTFMTQCPWDKKLMDFYKHLTKVRTCFNLITISK